MTLYILYADKDLKSLEHADLNNLHDWLTTNKLTLNTKKSNPVIFRPRQKKIHHLPHLSIFDSEKIEESAWNIILILSIQVFDRWKSFLEKLFGLYYH